MAAPVSINSNYQIPTKSSVPTLVSIIISIWHTYLYYSSPIIRNTSGFTN